MTSETMLAMNGKIQDAIALVPIPFGVRVHVEANPDGSYSLDMRSRGMRATAILSPRPEDAVRIISGAIRNRLEALGFKADDDRSRTC